MQFTLILNITCHLIICYNFSRFKFLHTERILSRQSLFFRLLSRQLYIHAILLVTYFLFQGIAKGPHQACGLVAFFLFCGGLLDHVEFVFDGAGVDALADLLAGL